MTREPLGSTMLLTHLRRAVGPGEPAVRAAGSPASGDSVRTFVYVDGFNLYYRALKGTKHKWLDLLKLAELALPASAQVERINYYTARVSGKRDSDMPRRQQIYFSALKTLPGVKIHLGKFLVHEVMMPFADPLEFRPPASTPPDPLPRFGKVIKTEEKGSDVTLGAHLVRDAFVGAFEQAAIVSNDSDLAEPLRIVVKEVGLPVILLATDKRPVASLARLATAVRHIDSVLGKAHFLNPVVSGGGDIFKPSGW